MIRNLFRSVATGLAIFAAIGSLSAAHLTGLNLFGVTWLSNQLVTINPLTGEATIVGTSAKGSFATVSGVRDGQTFVFDQVMIASVR
jgi:hypothetical protein